MIGCVKRYRRLRRLQADAELVRRRAAGETLRELACDYGVSHTTLSRYFARPEVATQLKQAAQLLRAEQRAAQARGQAGLRAEREARRLASRQVAGKRTTADRAHPDDAPRLEATPSRPDRSSLHPATPNDASQPEIADAQAAAGAAARYVQRLEAAYQHAFAAIEAWPPRSSTRNNSAAKSTSGSRPTRSASHRSGPNRGTCAPHSTTT
jgi:hypothetical protein